MTVDQGSGIGPLGGGPPGGNRPEGAQGKGKVKKTEDSDRTTGSSAPESPGETDLVVISGQAKQVARLRELIRREPDVRSARVMSLKNRIERGEYHVPAREILRKMVDMAIAEAKNRRKES